MSRLSKDDVNLRLLARLPVHIEGFGEITPPVLKNVISMGENKFQNSLSTLLFSKKSLEDTPPDYENFTDYQLVLSFVLYDDSFKESFFYGLRTFFNQEPQQHESGVIYFGEIEDELYLTEEVFHDMQEVLKIANFIEDKEEEVIEAGNERAKKFMEQLKKKKAKNPPKQKLNLHSLISALSWKSQGLDYVLGLTIYQLYDGYKRLENIDNYHYTLTGIYTGNIDSKGIKLPDINWANIIK